MNPISISPLILNLKRTPAEKILLAYLCQRAALSDGHCTDSNRELASGTAIHVQTVSDLINRLSQTVLLVATVDATLANQRTLRPSEELVSDYKPNDYSTQNDYKPNDYSPGEQPEPPKSQRLCSVTNLDITHQAEEQKVAIKATLYALYISDRSLFTELEGQFLGQSQTDQPISVRCIRLALAVRKLAKVQLTDEDEIRAPKLNERFCPVTGIDIGRQRNDVRYVTGQTLNRLARKDTVTFLALSAWLLPEEEPNLKYPGAQASRMAALVRELAASGLPINKPELPIRRCPVTKIDLSQQSPDYTLVTASTLKKMFDQDRSEFDTVAAQFLTQDELNQSRSNQCRTLVIRIKQKADLIAGDAESKIDSTGALSILSN